MMLTNIICLTIRTKDSCICIDTNACGKYTSLTKLPINGYMYIEVDRKSIVKKKLVSILIYKNITLLHLTLISVDSTYQNNYKL